MAENDRRRLRITPARLAALSVSTAAIAGGFYVLGPGAPSVVTLLAQDQDIWRLGKLRLEGVAGTGLNDLRVEHATLTDEKGIWLDARDLHLSWRPWRLLLGRVVLTEASAAKVKIARAPMLSPAKKDTGGPNLDADVALVRIDRLDIADGVAGPASAFAVSGGLRVTGGDIVRTGLDVRRLDKTLDQLRLDYLKTDEALQFSFALKGAPGGLFAALAQAPERSAVVVSAHAAGKTDIGAGALSAAIGDRPLAVGSLTWTPAQWSVDLRAMIDASPALAPLRARLGPTLRLSGIGAPPKPEGAMFHAALNTDNLTVEASGQLNGKLSPVGAVTLTAFAPRIAVLAPETALDSGSARFGGAIEFEDKRTRLEGRLGLVDAELGGLGVFSADGPVALTRDAARTSLLADIAFGGQPRGWIGKLTQKGELHLKAGFDSEKRRLNVERARFVGPALNLEGSGRMDSVGGALSGRWRLPRLQAMAQPMRGAAGGHWRIAKQKKDAPYTLTFDGEGDKILSTPPGYGQLLGPAPRMNGEVRYAKGDVEIVRARLEGRNLRMGAKGGLRRGALNVTLEASARGPVSFGAAELSGAADFSGRVSGSADRPRLNANARLAAFDVGGLAFQNTELSLDFDAKTGGRVGMEAVFAGQPARASARIAVRKDGAAFEGVEAVLAGLRAEGEAALLQSGPQARIGVSGRLDGVVPNVIGGINGSLRYRSPPRGRAVLAVDAALTRVQFGHSALIESGHVSAEGPIDALATKLSLSGWAGQSPAKLEGTGIANLGEGGPALSLNAKGALAGEPFETEQPARLKLAGDAVEAGGVFCLGAGRADLTWRGGKGALSASGHLQNAPLAALSAFSPQALTGTATGDFALRGKNDNLTGEASLSLAEVRLAHRTREAVDAQLHGTLAGGKLKGGLTAKSASGLSASVDFDVPVAAHASPFFIALAKGEHGSAGWRVEGPVDGLWALFGPLDKSLTGRVQGAGQAQFTTARVTGEGGLELTDGRFEDKTTGIVLQRISSRLAFDNQGVSLQRFDATDGKAGRVQGSGRLKGEDEGELVLTLTNMRLVNRADAQATGGGKLVLAWKDERLRLSGDLKVDQATVAPPNSGPPEPAQIDVVELNKPGPPARPERAPPVLPARLDIHVSAPNRIETRGRGLDAEWSLDVNVRGPIASPKLYGEARLLRGYFSLAGRRFELSRGLVTFAGDPEDAVVDIQAVGESSDLTVTITITGSIDDPTIELTSNPALPEDEILPELVFGRSSRDLSPLEAAQLAASLATLAGRTSFDVVAAARAVVSLDRLEVRQGTSGIEVAGGKYITHDVYVEVARGAVGATSTQIEWQVRTHLYLISSFLPNGDQRIAVRWRHEY